MIAAGPGASKEIDLETLNGPGRQQAAAATPVVEGSVGARAGDFVFVAGMRGIDPATGALSPLQPWNRMAPGDGVPDGVNFFSYKPPVKNDALLDAASAAGVKLYGGESLVTSLDASVSGELGYFRLPGGTIAMAAGMRILDRLTEGMDLLQEAQPLAEAAGLTLERSRLPQRPLRAPDFRPPLLALILLLILLSPWSGRVAPVVPEGKPVSLWMDQEKGCERAGTGAREARARRCAARSLTSL